MKNLLLFLVFGMQNSIAFAQDFQWAVQAGGTGNDQGYSVIADPAGNVFTTGVFSGTADFDPGVETYNLTSIGAEDVFISKSDNAGNLVWAISMGGTLDDYSYSIALDDSGNVFTMGAFRGTVDFDAGASVKTITSFGLSDIFILKSDPSGNLIWVKRLGGAAVDYGYGIAVDAIGNVFTTGWFAGTADFDPGAGISNLTSQTGGADVFVCKLNTAGNFAWAKRIGGASTDWAWAIAIDKFDNVYTTGYFFYTSDFDPSQGVYNMVSTGGADVFISKLDSSGNFSWSKKFGGASDEYGLSIKVDEDGAIYTTGYFTGTADFDPGAGVYNLVSVGSKDIFVLKLDAAGNFVWAESIGSVEDDEGVALAVDSYRNIYVTGYFGGAADFDSGAEEFNLTPVGSGDIFVLKLDNSGGFGWAKNSGGSALNKGNAIAVGSSGSVLTTGFFGDVVDFDPGSSVSNLTSFGAGDVFILQLDDGVVTDIANQFLNSDLFVYPNPTASFINIEIPKTHSVVEVTLYNYLGALLYKETMEGSVSDQFQFNLSTFPEGIYILFVKTEDKIIAKRIVKSNGI